MHLHILGICGTFMGGIAVIAREAGHTVTATGGAGPDGSCRAHRDLPFIDGAFDFVLVDAPCSRLGTVRRDPDIRWARTEEDLGRLAVGQRTLLHRAAPLVVGGGTLIYSTCSSEPDENEAVVAAFLADATGSTLRQTHQATPPEDGLDAFYGAVLVRNV